jgi:hypothetical protein
MTEHGMTQQQPSQSPQSQGMHGLVGPLMLFTMLEVDEDVEGGMFEEE